MLCAASIHRVSDHRTYSHRHEDQPYTIKLERGPQTAPCLLMDKQIVPTHRTLSQLALMLISATSYVVPAERVTRPQRLREWPYSGEDHRGQLEQNTGPVVVQTKGPSLIYAVSD